MARKARREEAIRKDAAKMIAEGTHVCAQCGEENEEPDAEPRGFCSDVCKSEYDRTLGGEQDASALAVPDLGPPLPESNIPAVSPAETTRPSHFALSTAILNSYDEVHVAESEVAKWFAALNAAKVALQDAIAAKVAQMLADGTRLVSIGGVTYEAKRGRKGAAPTLVPVKVGE